MNGNDDYQTNNFINRSSHWRRSEREGVLRNFAKFNENYMCQSLFFNKVTLAQVLSCEFCEISKNTFFIGHLLATANINNSNSNELRNFNKNDSNDIDNNNNKLIAMMNNDNNDSNDKLL